MPEIGSATNTTALVDVLRTPKQYLSLGSLGHHIEHIRHLRRHTQRGVMATACTEHAPENVISGAKNNVISLPALAAADIADLPPQLKPKAVFYRAKLDRLLSDEQKSLRAFRETEKLFMWILEQISIAGMKNKSQDNFVDRLPLIVNKDHVDMLRGDTQKLVQDHPHLATHADFQYFISSMTRLLRTLAPQTTATDRLIDVEYLLLTYGMGTNIQHSKTA